MDSIENPSGVVDNASNYAFVDIINIDNILKAYDVKVHNMFHSKELMMNIMNMIAIQSNFEFKIVRSCTTRLLKMGVIGCLEHTV